MIALVDYNAGNITSVMSALDHLGFAYIKTNSPDVIRKAKKVILPGQGRAGQVMDELRKCNIVEILKTLTTPFLGICIGFQLLAEYSEEDKTTCLGVLPGQVKKITGSQKIPHIGWNRIEQKKPSPLLKNIPNNIYAYFVHSYYLDTPDTYIVATTPYGISFPSIIQKDNYYATQFHLEKSGDMGLQMLKNFCAL